MANERHHKQITTNHVANTNQNKYLKQPQTKYTQHTTQDSKPTKTNAKITIKTPKSKQPTNQTVPSQHQAQQITNRLISTKINKSEEIMTLTQ